MTLGASFHRYARFIDGPFLSRFDPFQGFVTSRQSFVRRRHRGNCSCPGFIRHTRSAATGQIDRNVLVPARRWSELCVDAFVGAYPALLRFLVALRLVRVLLFRAEHLLFVANHGGCRRGVRVSTS